MSGAHLPESLLQNLQKQAEVLGLEPSACVQMLQNTLELLQPGPESFLTPYSDPVFRATLDQALSAQEHFIRHYALGD
jgi:hypothetical protein